MKTLYKYFYLLPRLYYIDKYHEMYQEKGKEWSSSHVSWGAIWNLSARDNCDTAISRKNTNFLGGLKL